MAGLEEMNETAGQLVEKSKAGCLESFEQLVRMHEKPIYNYLLQLTGNAHDAEDAAQETFVKAFRGLHQYQSRYRFSTWLFTIAKHTAISHYRKSRRQNSLEALDAELEAPQEQESGAGDVWLVAKRLKPKLYEVLWLHYGEGFQASEVARIMNTNAIYVKVLLHRARHELKKRLKPDDR